MIERIYCGVQNYVWGKVGASSTVAQLATKSAKNFRIDPASPYAELWMGTHPKAPATLASSGAKLGDSLGELGEVITKQFGAQLPFLLKILSVNQALSIQAHPSKKHAEELHARDPAHYPDSNHKPEMCVALTKFTGLCGFRPQAETCAFVRAIPELAALLGNAELDVDAAKYPGELKKAFSSLMNTDKSVITEAVNSFVSRVQADKSADTEEKYLKSLLLTLNEKYAGDVGLFNIYFLNYVNLEPGEAMFLRANLPHAYLSGDCVECMACSDNVVRAGLTPKFMDVSTLCDMLDYTPKSATANKFTAESELNGVKTFNPDVPDFALQEIKLATGVTTLAPVDSASITIVTAGSGTMGTTIDLSVGVVVYMSAGERVELNIESNLTAYRAFVK